jgi:phage FluMu gp28-like protein
VKKRPSKKAQRRTSYTPAPAQPRVPFRRYQLPAFTDRTTPILILEWSRQIGKSYTLAAWAVDRLLTRPGRLVTVLSNSKDNGAEFASKCCDIARELQAAYALDDLSPDEAGKPAAQIYEEMRFEVRITVAGKEGRIKVLAANPRTARGFSGDLILDEFAFHQDAEGIWDAAFPILSSNDDFLCRIASTHNGTGSLFNRMILSGKYKLLRVRRSDAWAAGEIKIRNSVTGQPITPEQARAEALDPDSYDENFECIARGQAGRLLPAHLVAAAIRPEVGAIGDGGWDPRGIALIAQAKGRLALGWDVARRRHFSVFSVWEQFGAEYFCRAVARLQNVDFNAQLAVLDAAMRAASGRLQICIDQTGLGEGPVDFARSRWPGRVQGIHFSSSLPLLPEQLAQGDGNRTGTAAAPLVLGANLLKHYLGGQLHHPADTLLQDDLGKPRRVIGENNRATIAADDGPDGHADHFWSFALALWALRADATFGAFTPETIAQVRLGGARRGLALVSRPTLR